MDGAEQNRQYLREFIGTYRDLAVLWDNSLRDYSNRDKRAAAYEQLVPIYRCLKRDATVADVKKKINTLRTNYRKELKVVERARHMGMVHAPRCWTFLELDFLRNTEKFLAVNPKYRLHQSLSAFSESSQASFIEPASVNSAGGGRSSSSYSFGTMMPSTPNVSDMFHQSFGGSHPVKLDDSLQPQHAAATGHNHQSNSANELHPPPPQQQQAQQQQKHEPNTNSSPAGNSSSLTIASIASLGTANCPTATGDLKRRNSSLPTVSGGGGNGSTNSTPNTSLAPQNPDELLGIACDYLAGQYPEEESIARTWSHKLKRMQRDQRLLAEKFINEILFEGESGCLQRNSVQINQQFHHVNSPYVQFEEQHTASNDNHEQPGSEHSEVDTEAGDTKRARTDCAPDGVKKAASTGDDGGAGSGAAGDYNGYECFGFMGKLKSRHGDGSK